MASRVIRMFTFIALVVPMGNGPEIMMVGIGTEAMPCGQVKASLKPCVNYAREGGSMPKECCAGCQKVVDASRSNGDLKVSCGCMVKMVGSVPGMKYDLFNNIDPCKMWNSPTPLSFLLPLTVPRCIGRRGAPRHVRTLHLNKSRCGEQMPFECPSIFSLLVYVLIFMSM